VLAVAALAWLALGLLSFPDSVAWGFDFQAYHAAAERLADGVGLYTSRSLSGSFEPTTAGLYLYPPPFAVGVLPLASVPLDAATVVWYVLHVLALGAACALLPVRPVIRLASFAVAAAAFAVVRDLVLGNVSVLLLLPLAATWRWLDRPIGSIAMACVIAVKPTTAVFLAWWALRRHWRALGWCLGAGIALLVATIPLVGIEAYGDYLTMLRNVSGVTGARGNLDLGSTALRLGADGAAPGLAYLAGAAVGVLAILLGLRRDREVGFMVTLGASLLLSPLLWDHYLAMLVLPAAFLAQRGRPWAILLPLATWLPHELLGVVAVAATLLPFLARDDGAAAREITLRPQTL
jgi:alpha-1,2-mannosyltransferase